MIFVFVLFVGFCDGVTSKPLQTKRTDPSTTSEVNVTHLVSYGGYDTVYGGDAVAGADPKVTVHSSWEAFSGS